MHQSWYLFFFYLYTQIIRLWTLCILDDQNLRWFPQALSPSTFASWDYLVALTKYVCYIQFLKMLTTVHSYMINISSLFDEGFFIDHDESQTIEMND